MKYKFCKHRLNFIVIKFCVCSVFDKIKKKYKMSPSNFILIILHIYFRNGRLGARSITFARVKGLLLEEEIF